MSIKSEEELKKLNKNIEKLNKNTERLSKLPVVISIILLIITFVQLTITIFSNYSSWKALFMYLMFSIMIYFFSNKIINEFINKN